MPVVHTTTYQAKALYLGRFASHPVPGVDPQPVAFMLLSRSTTKDSDSLAAKPAGEGTVIYLIPPAETWSPGTEGRLIYHVVSPNMTPWTEFQFESFSRTKPFHRLPSLLKQPTHANQFYALLRLQEAGIGLETPNVDELLMEAFRHKLIALTDSAWLLKNAIRLERLAALAQEHDYAKALYFFSLLEARQPEDALAYWRRHRAILPTVLTACHNATMMNKIRQSETVPGLDVPPDTARAGESVDWDTLLEASLLITLGRSQEADPLIRRIQADRAGLRTSLQTDHPLKPWVYIPHPFLAVPRPVDYLAPEILQHTDPD